MNENVTDFGIICRLYRQAKRMPMTDAAKVLGCTQHHITQIEQGKFNPTYEYIEKSLKLYDVPENKKADFIAKALAGSKQITFKMDKVTATPKEDLVKLLAVLLFNLDEPYPDDKEWYAMSNVLKKLKECISRRPGGFTVLE